MKAMLIFKQGNMMWISVSASGEDYFRSHGTWTWEVDIWTETLMMRSLYEVL